MGTIVERLRVDTRGEHDAIEQALDWETGASRPDVYRRWIERLYGFHLSWEPAIAAAIDEPSFIAPRGKLHLLATDLDRLGVAAASRAALAVPPVRFESRAEALGSMYVLEGSTLGGQLIARRVREQLGHDAAYHGAYGARTGAMWRAFKAHLQSTIAPAEEDAAVAGAVATFMQLRLWLI